MSMELRNSLGLVRTLAANTWLEARRDKVLYLLLFFGLFVFGATRLLVPLALGQGERVTLNLGFTAISAFGCMTAIFVGHQMIFREVERKTLYFLFARPLGRWEFVCGKYLGLLATLLAAVSLMGAILALLMLAYGYSVGPGFLQALGMAALEMVVLAAVAMLWAAVTSPVLAGLLTLAAWIIGHGAGELWLLMQQASGAGASILIRIASWIVPRLDLYGDILPVLQGGAYPAAQLWYGALYAVLYAGAALTIASVALSRREFAL